METLVVGIDAACRRVLDPLFSDDVTPTLQRIFEHGTNASLQSQIPPWTASAWPSLYTGKNPGKHGIYDFIRFEGYDWRVVTASDLREPPLWQLLDVHGRSSVVVNAPVTAPVRPFDGALVPGYMAPENPTCHPAGLLDEIRDAIGSYRVYPAHTGETASRDDARDEYQTLTSMRGAAFRYLADRFDPDFGFLQFQQTDTLFHEHPDDPALIEAVYEAVDREIEQTLSACAPDTVFVVSDHGMGPYDGYEIRLNELLRSEGYLTTTSAGTGMPTWSTIRDSQLAAGGHDVESTPGTLERLMSALSTVGITSQRIERACKAIGIDDIVRERAPERMVHAAAEQVDFPASDAYVRSRIELGVRINLEGREPDGTVPPDEYETVRQSLVSLLSSLETPNGVPVFEEVAPREAFFDGPVADEAVDIVTVPNDFDQFVSATVGTAPFGEPSEPWNHKCHGIIAADGTAIDTEAHLDAPHLFDVAPTILASMGIPHGDRMDGSVLALTTPAGEHRYNTLEAIESERIDEPVVEDRLSDLGYLE